MKRLYYWQGLQSDVDPSVKMCLNCKRSLRPQRHAQLYTEVPSAPMHFIAMDLIGHHKPSSKGTQNTLIAID